MDPETKLAIFAAVATIIVVSAIVFLAHVSTLTTVNDDDAEKPETD